MGYISNNQLYYVHNDHLGRPEVITDANQAIVWQAKLEAFDRSVLTTSIGDFNIGFPGQYWDEEKQSWYNYFRDYDATTGRYLQSDPIGLAGGINTYGYVGGSPINWVDPYGLTGLPGMHWPGINPYYKTPVRQPLVRMPDYIQFSIDNYIFHASGAFSRSGNSFFGGGFARNYPNPLKLGVSITGVWLNQCAKPSGEQVDIFLNGVSGSASGFVILGGGLVYSPGNGTANVIGLGAGTNSFGLNGEKMYLQGNTGLGGW